MSPDNIETPNRTTRDIYALGCTIYELLTGEVPFCEKKMDFQIIMAVLNGFRPRRPGNCPDALWRIVDRCWGEDASERPSASAVASELGRIDVILQQEELNVSTLIRDILATQTTSMEKNERVQWLPEQATHLPILSKRRLKDAEISCVSKLGQPQKQPKIHVPTSSFQSLPTQTDGVGQPTSLNAVVYSTTEEVLQWLERIEEYKDNHLRSSAPDAVSGLSSPPDLFPSSVSYSSAIITENNKAIEDWVVKARESLGEFDGSIGVSGRMSKKYSEDIPSSGDDEEAKDIEAAGGTLDLQGRIAKDKRGPCHVVNPSSDSSGDLSNKLHELNSDDEAMDALEVPAEQMSRCSSPLPYPSPLSCLSLPPASLASSPGPPTLSSLVCSESLGSLSPPSPARSTVSENKHSGTPMPGEEVKVGGLDAEGEVEESLYKLRLRDKVEPDVEYLWDARPSSASPNDFDDDEYSGDLPSELESPAERMLCLSPPPALADIVLDRATSSSASQISDSLYEVPSSLESVGSPDDCDWNEASGYPRSLGDIRTWDDIHLREAWQRFRGRVGLAAS
ncbi:Homeobox protein tos8 [Marasmius crinis-equi]|uniref:Homeobox protein tos8 n=1 Tax=Marasmius crinis-equi TaxID=585013 RepID=A0ABR3EZW5_9AGAR